MSKFNMSVELYRRKLEREFGFVSEILVQEYADAKAKHRRAKNDKFNPFTEDPNCKTCGKKG